MPEQRPLVEAQRQLCEARANGQDNAPGQCSLWVNTRSQPLSVPAPSQGVGVSQCDTHMACLSSMSAPSVQAPASVACRLHDSFADPDIDCAGAGSEELPYTEEFFLPGSGASRGLTSTDLEASRTATWDDVVATVSIDDVEKPGAVNCGSRLCAMDRHDRVVLASPC